MPGEEVGDSLADALAHVREMAGLIDRGASDEVAEPWDLADNAEADWPADEDTEAFDDAPYEPAGNGHAESPSSLYVPTMVAPVFDRPEPDAPAAAPSVTSVAAAELALATQEWRVPKLAMPASGIRKLAGVHWLAEALYLPIHAAVSGAHAVGRFAVEALRRLGSGFGAVIAMLIVRPARGLARLCGRTLRAVVRGVLAVLLAPVRAIGHMDLTAIVVLLFTLTGVVLAVSLALR